MAPATYVFGLSDNILPQGGPPTFISIVRQKAYIIGLGLGVYEGRPKYTNVFEPAIDDHLLLTYGMV